MTTPDDDLGPLFDAGAAAVAFNAPLSMTRAEQLIDRLALQEPAVVVDLGCGHGELVRALARRLTEATVIGIDIDDSSVQSAEAKTQAAGLDDRARFEVADATTWSGTADAALCVGASHAFGGPGPMFNRLADVVPQGTVVVGDSNWQQPPSPWCLEAFGPLPDGLNEVRQLASDAGWTVTRADESTMDEWDDFERTWSEGVRAVGTEAAARFAESRQQEYLDHYRGVLGFCWLELAR